MSDEQEITPKRPKLSNSASQLVTKSDIVKADEDKNIENFVLPPEPFNITQNTAGFAVQGNAAFYGPITQHIMPEVTTATKINSFILIDRPTPYFTGRKATMDLIYERFKICLKQNSYSDRIVVLHGLGGIGKSELARAYASTYVSDSIIQNVAWIDAENETSLNASFVALAKQLELASHSNKVTEIVRDVYYHFSDHVGTGLFIFDNAPQMNRTAKEFGVYNFLPIQLLKRSPLVLITTRDNEWDGILDDNLIHVQKLVDDDSVNFLLKALKLTNKPKDQVLWDVKRLAESLEGFPVALTLAASKIRNAKWAAIGPKIGKYIEQMDIPKGGWTQHKLSTGAATNYKLIMSNVWSASLEQIASYETEGTDALRLLNLMAFLPADGLSIQSVSDIFHFMFKNPCDEEGFQLLEKYSLINVMSGTDEDHCRIRIHRLVQLCTREKLDCVDDFSFLFEICEYVMRQKKDNQFLRERSCMHEHLKQRHWPGDSIKYSIIYCAINIKPQGFQLPDDLS